MALDIYKHSPDKAGGVDFFFDKHPMATGGSWIDPNSRGYRGSATAGPKKVDKLKTVLQKELDLSNLWFKNGDQGVMARVLKVAAEYKVVEIDSPEQETMIKNYDIFESKVVRGLSSKFCNGKHKINIYNNNNNNNI